ncbi:DUF2975 domain-containing protein [Solwaraspora sp. WMMD1047]|uniref:DUF2975 domain-containing protein n=1 Tax=Solwaraspora sp. WMMD1047 TaxID=3016102 RepID=UPI002416F0C8|nr:DUF2975 domain-containing protein [Solwaraspora sp. WMMD1047]MDG4832357.1 DUF2975 domain-containing protein [Solwaraspora sp. WMMD1047]
MRGFIDRLRKPDWLAEMRAVLIAGLALFAVVVTGNLALTLTGNRDVVVEVPAKAVDGVAGASGGLTGGAVVRPSSAVVVHLPEPTAGQLVADTLTGLPSALVVLAMLVLLFQVVRRAQRAEPFSAYVVRRLRLAAVVALVGGVLAGLVEAIAALNLSMSATGGEGTTTWQFPLPWILAGFGLFAVAEVIGRGVAMRAELETVI